MKIIDLAKLSTRMFKARTSRTILTILGMSVGIGAVFFLVGLGYGIQKIILETITTADSLLSLNAAPKENKLLIDKNDLEEIKRVDGVEKISPVLEMVGKVKSFNTTSDSKILLVDSDFIKLDGIKVKIGETFSDSGRREIIISNSLARVFEKEPKEMIGQEVEIFLADINNRGIKEEKNSILVKNSEIGKFRVIGCVDIKGATAFINLADVEERILSSGFSRLKIKCFSSSLLENVRASLTEKGYTVSALTDLVKQVNKTFGILRIILGIFGSIALVVSAIGMFNTMTVALLERTEEIGIMKSIGASKWDIILMFIFESSIMGFLGGVFGILIGYLGGAIFNFFVNFLAVRMGGNAISLFYFPFWFVVLILILAGISGFLTGILPARRASVIDPLEALRYK